MNDIVLNWQKISKGIPYRKKAADDRSPTIDEIKKLLDTHREFLMSVCIHYNYICDG
jgi:hypothetical protein